MKQEYGASQIQVLEGLEAHKNVLDMNNTTVFYIDNGKVVKTENGGN